MTVASNNAYYHGTSKATLMSIAEKGLLTSEMVKKIGETVVYPCRSKPKSVYLTDNYDGAQGWSHDHPTVKCYQNKNYDYIYRNNVVLHIQLNDEETERLIPDRNFYSCKRTDAYYSPNKFEYEGVIPPERISVMQGRYKIVPLSVYVEKYQKGIIKARKTRREC